MYVVDGKHVKIKVRGEDGGWYMVAGADTREGGWGVGRDEGTGFEAEELLMRAGALFLSVRSVGDIKDDGVNGLWGVRGKAGPTPAAPAPAADVLFWLGSIAAPLGVDGGGYAGGRDIIGLSAAGRTAAVFPAIMTPGS